MYCLGAGRTRWGGVRNGGPEDDEADALGCRTMIHQIGELVICQKPLSVALEKMFGNNVEESGTECCVYKGG